MGGAPRFGLTNVCGFFTEGDFLPPIYFYLVINENKWNSLPPDLQKVLEDASGARFAALGGGTERISPKRCASPCGRAARPS